MLQRLIIISNNCLRMTTEIFYALDLIGTFAFAVYGSYVGQRKNLDIFGIAVCALVSSFGGGVIREVLLNSLPQFLFDGWYIAAVFLGIGFGILSFRHAHRIQRFMLSIDALGLVTFALLGASRAAENGLGVIGICLFAVLSAVGGGVIRDLLIREIPEVLYQDFYATPALLLGIVFAVCEAYRAEPIFLYGLLFAVFIVRLLAIKYKIQLWKPGLTEK